MQCIKCSHEIIAGMEFNYQHFMVNSNNGNLPGVYLILGTHGKQAMKEKKLFWGQLLALFIGCCRFWHALHFHTFSKKKASDPWAISEPIIEAWKTHRAILADTFGKRAGYKGLALMTLSK